VPPPDSHERSLAAARVLLEAGGVPNNALNQSRSERRRDELTVVEDADDDDMGPRA
jgi:hypothetical protein